jgi:hypothetical protein
MFASLSIETAVSTIIAENPSLSASDLAALDGLASSTLSKVLSGQSKLPADKEASLRLTLQAIRAVVADYPGVPVDLHQVGKAKILVDKKKLELRESNDPIVPACLVVRLSRFNFFSRINQGNVVAVPSETTCAAFEDINVVEELVRQLQALGTPCKWERLGAMRRKSSISRSLFEVGFQQEPVAVEA